MKKIVILVMSMFMLGTVNAATQMTISDPPKKLTVTKQLDTDNIKICAGQPLIAADISCADLRESFKDIGLYTESPDGQVALCHRISQVCCGDVCTPESL